MSIFSEEEKIAVIKMIYEVAKSDGHIHDDELKYINVLCDSYKINYDETIIKAKEMDADDAIEAIKNLDDDKKADLGVKMATMILADGVVDKGEEEFLIKVSRLTGIPLVF